MIRYLAIAVMDFLFQFGRVAAILFFHFFEIYMYQKIKIKLVASQFRISSFVKNQKYFYAVFCQVGCLQVEFCRVGFWQMRFLQCDFGNRIFFADGKLENYPIKLGLSDDATIIFFSDTQTLPVKQHLTFTML